MKTALNQRGSVLGEFAFLVPFVLIATFTVLQLMLLVSQRSQTHAIADRLGFISATSGIAAAQLEAIKYQNKFADIKAISITKSGSMNNVKLSATANLLLPLNFEYQINIVTPVEP
jgi:Flp pilus assembly protein TadG